MSKFHDNEPNDGHRHERDPFRPTHCWRCGKKMRAPAMSGRGRAR